MDRFAFLTIIGGRELDGGVACEALEFFEWVHFRGVCVWFFLLFLGWAEGRFGVDLKVFCSKKIDVDEWAWDIGFGNF